MLCNATSSSTSPSYFTNLRNNWSWKKTGALAVVLALITAALLYAAGVNSIAALCSLGAPVLFFPILLHATLPKQPLKEGRPYNLEHYKDEIIFAIRTNTALMWEGRPENTSEEISIFPNFRIGKKKERDNQVVILFSPLGLETDVQHPIDLNQVWGARDKKYYWDHLGSASPLDKQQQDEKMVACVQKALLAGHPVLITAEMTQLMPVGSKESSVIDAGIMLMLYLCKLTSNSGITQEQVKRYVENLLGCTYQDKLYVPHSGEEVITI